jgi:hypothetical protein
VSSGRTHAVVCGTRGKGSRMHCNCNSIGSNSSDGSGRSSWQRVGQEMETQPSSSPAAHGMPECGERGARSAHPVDGVGAPVHPEGAAMSSAHAVHQ